MSLQEAIDILFSGNFLVDAERGLLVLENLALRFLSCIIRPRKELTLDEDLVKNSGERPCFYMPQSEVVTFRYMDSSHPTRISVTWRHQALYWSNKSSNCCGASDELSFVKRIWNFVKRQVSQSLLQRKLTSKASEVLASATELDAVPRAVSQINGNKVGSTLYLARTRSVANEIDMKRHT